jgi:hypothetical protein
MDLSEDFRKNLVLVGVCVALTAVAAAGHNLVTPDEPVNVGMVEVETNCAGIDVGVCLGIQRQDHTTYNYDNYTEISEGDPNYYRKVESELMLRASNTCDQSMDGYEWTEEVSYDGRSAEEWRENDNVQLLPCEETFYRNLSATS